ncbi:helix-turn-helix domain-containing protein [Flavobacterium qiangtangense]|uniref:Helix-turn-helix domain-containing protein n=1 Tax=Flavobacterium qiangtangense TaxID=1442595 RepID=A0ABW1PS22_9FLAO
MRSLSEIEISRLSNEIPKLVGEQIVIFRKLRNLSQTELAEMVGKDRQYLYKIEKGRVTPNITTLSILAKALNVSLSELMGNIKI